MLKSEVQKRKIELEDDSLREGAQSLLGKTLSTDDLFDFVRMVDQLGIDHLICGFPGASEAEFKNTRDLLKKMTKSKLGVVPWVLARLREEDTDQFLDLKEATGHENVGISFFISVDSERLKLERWSFDDINNRLSQFLKKTASSQIKHVSLNLEGVSRTKPEHIQRILDLLSDFEFYSLVLCDSLGICLPGDVRQLVSAFKSHRPVNERLVWHGHNDFGLATANSLVAWQSGVDVVSGTFTGIGERAGNLPLEQFILILNEKFGYEFDLSVLMECCQFLMKNFDFSVHKFSPFIGEFCYQTQVGTHGAALIKARDNGRLDDSIYTPFDYRKVGKLVEFKLGPQSGRRMCREKLMELGFSGEPDLVDSLHAWVKEQTRVLDDYEIKNWMSQGINNE